MSQGANNFVKDFFDGMNRDKLRKYHELNQIAEKGQTVCAGSSLMEFFPINEMLMNLGSTKKVYNRGMAAFTIDQYDEVLDVCVLELKPSKLFINIGSNDLNLPGDTIGNLVRKYKALLERIKEALPECRITMMAFYPCRDDDNAPQMEGRVPRTMALVNQANEQLEKLAGELGCEWLDCNAPLLAEDGMLREDIMTDAIHFSPLGYVEVLKILEPYL